MNKNKIIIKMARNKEPYVVVKSKNNKTVATTETYKKLRGAEKAANSLKKIVKNAVVMNKIKKG